MIAEVIDNTTSRGRAIRFLTEMPHDKFLTILKSLGELAVPIILDRPIEPIDNEYFQTVFAKVEGSVLPPFAGLHFTPLLMKRMEVKVLILPKSHYILAQEIYAKLMFKT